MRGLGSGTRGDATSRPKHEQPPQGGFFVWWPCVARRWDARRQRSALEAGAAGMISDIRLRLRPTTHAILRLGSGPRGWDRLVATTVQVAPMSIVRLLAIACLAAVALCPPAAVGAELHRCVSPTKVVGYHATACPHGHRELGIVHYAPVPDSIARPALSEPTPVRTPRATRIARSNATGRGSRTQTRNDLCRIAKQQRRAAENRIGLKRTYADLGELDAPVRAACNGY